MKKILLLFVILLLPTCVFAVTSDPEALPMASGSADGSNYKTQNIFGDSLTGTISGSSYSMLAGFGATLTVVSTGGGVDPDPPNISQLRFDGYSILSGDLVDPNVTITAIVTDAASGIDTLASYVGLDSVQTSFSSLSADSSYDPSTGVLTYKASSLSSGTYTFTIYAQDNSNNSVSLTIDFTVDTGDLKVEGKVLNFPNPFNPDQDGSTEIAYRLNRNAKITVYIFNAAGRQIWKRSFIEGEEGGHAGYNVVTWDGVSDFGQTVANDIYFCRIAVDGRVIGGCKIAVIK